MDLKIWSLALPGNLRCGESYALHIHFLVFIFCHKLTYRLYALLLFGLFFFTSEFLFAFRMLHLKLPKSFRASQIWLLGITVMETLLPLYWHISLMLHRFLNAKLLTMFNFSVSGSFPFSLITCLGCYMQCTIAHALEKTKYPDSDINWKKLEDKYHFSCQFTADLIAMNHTDFIITSTFQEIAGR